MNLGGWIAALIIGVILLVVAPHVPPPGGKIMRIIGIVLCVVAAVLFVLWLVGVLTGATVGA
jgi:hypothetical protein